MVQDLWWKLFGRKPGFDEVGEVVEMRASGELRTDRTDPQHFYSQSESSPSGSAVCS